MIPDTLRDDDFILANDVVLEEESDDYQRGYMNTLSAQQKQYSLRSRDVPINPVQKRKELQPKNDSLNTQRKGKESADPSPNKTSSVINIANENN